MFTVEKKNEEMKELTDYLLSVKRTISATAAASIIVVDDKIVYESYFGTHNNDINSRIVDETSQFNVGSIRKTYLGLLVSMAIYEGKIKSVDDYVWDYDKELNKEL